MGVWRQGEGASLGSFIAISGTPKGLDSELAAASNQRPSFLPQLPGHWPQHYAVRIARARAKNTLEDTTVDHRPRPLGYLPADLPTYLPSSETWCAAVRGRLPGLLELQVAPG